MAVFWPRFVVDAAKTLWRPLNTVLFSSRGAIVSVRCLCLWPWCRRTLPPSGVNRSKYIATWCFTSNHFLGSFIFIIWETAKRYCHCETWCLKWIGELTSQSYKKKYIKKRMWSTATAPFGRCWQGHLACISGSRSLTSFSFPAIAAAAAIAGPQKVPGLVWVTLCVRIRTWLIKWVRPCGPWRNKVQTREKSLVISVFTVCTSACACCSGDK